MQVVSFQVPWPADYGGVIDVYYKLRALKALGQRIVLHTFEYAGRGASPQLEEVADEVYYYPRHLDPRYLASRMPFIVRSRFSPDLLGRLLAAPADEPILFEGLHTTAYLPHPALRNRCKIVRAHNVEHDYYRQLASSTPALWKRLFLQQEARKLRRHEQVLANADGILAISEADRDHFASLYGERKVALVPCFYDDSPKKAVLTPEDEALIPEGPFVYYHGNLEVEENSSAALHILRDVWPRVKGTAPLVIAGRNPGDALREAAAATPGVILLPSPSSAVIDALMERASVNVLLTGQPTGIKLKLLNTLSRGNGHVVANSAMANDSRLAALCRVSDDPTVQASLIDTLAGSYITDAERKTRNEVLSADFSTLSGARRILTLCENRR